jgi:hypothetical protein
LVACSNPEPTQETPVAINSTPEVLIQILDDTKSEAREISIDVIQQPNCGGNAEVESQVERSVSIIRILEAGAGLEVNANGQVGFAGTGVELGAAVASQIGYTYGSEDNITRSITVKARPGTKMEHQISLQEIWEVGTAKIVVNDQELLVPFSFRKDFSMELVNSTETGCPIPTTFIESTDFTSPTPILPTNTPVSTDTPVSTIAPSPTQLPTNTPTTQSKFVLEGAIEEILPPPSVKVAEYEDSKSMVIFQEVHQFTLTSPIIVDVSEPGIYSSRDERTPDSIPEGTIIDSYFIHLDPIGTSPVVDLKGTITFDTKIIGIILLADQLNASDLIIAAGTNTKYPTGGVDRRFEFGEDRIVVSENMRTINIELLAGTQSDQIRIITESSAR